MSCGAGGAVCISRRDGEVGRIKTLDILTYVIYIRLYLEMRHPITVCSMCEDLVSMHCTVVLESACLVVDVAPDNLGKPWTNEFLFVENHIAGTDCISAQWTLS